MATQAVRIDDAKRLQVLGTRTSKMFIEAGSMPKGKSGKADGRD